MTTSEADESTEEVVEAGRVEGIAQTRELQVTREIATAFLTATRPVEVYRLALARVTPIVQASFSSIFLRDPADPLLLRLECAQSWPQASARFLGHLRFRVGRGPTGSAVAENRPVEVPDVFADPLLREWWEPARELGFASMITLPLGTDGEVSGALSFYFTAPHVFEDDERRLLGLVADLLSATSSRAHVVEDLRGENARLERENRALRDRIDAAQATRRMKDEFLANVSHELRTPLNAILGYAELLTSHQIGALQPAQASAVGRIDDAATILHHLITDLLELSHLKLGRVDLVVTTEDAVRLARRAAELVGPSPDGIDLSIETDEALVPISTDGDKVTKILTHLLANALKFTSEGSVKLHVGPCHGPRGGWVEWRVTDTGVGIRAEDLSAIFDEFTQVDGSSTRLYGGTGLGLALSQRLAELLGGEIGVESEPNAGSTFTLRLPNRVQGS